MKKGKAQNSRKGVSPVIGVILMVAATIVIASVVISMLGGFGPMGEVYVVSATATEQVVGGTPTIFVTYIGGPDAIQVDCITANIDGVVDNAWTIPPSHIGANDWGVYGDGTNDATVGTGGVQTSGVVLGDGNNHVIVTATFLDGTSQVILDTFV